MLLRRSRNLPRVKRRSALRKLKCFFLDMEKALPTPPKATSLTCAQSKTSLITLFTLFSEIMSSIKDTKFYCNVHFFIHGSTWSETLHHVRTTSHVGALNENFKILTGRLVPDYDNNKRDKLRVVHFEGREIDPDTRLEELLAPNQTDIILYFVWRDTFNANDQEIINAFLNEQNEREFEEAGEEFLHELDLYYEDQLYTAQDHDEREPSTLSYAKVAQKACIEKHHKTASAVSNGFDDPWELDHASGSVTPKLQTNTTPCDCLPRIIVPPGGDTPAFSLCIPRVFQNIGERRIRAIFINLGYPQINEIDFVCCEGRNKHTGQHENYNRVFVHFLPMSVTQQTFTVRRSLRKMFNGEQVKIVYDDPWYWMVSLSRSTRPEKRPAPPRIVLEDPRERMTESQIWGHDEDWSSYHYYKAEQW